MDFCSGDLQTIIVVLKRIYLLMEYSIIIILIVLCTVDVFKIFLTKKEDDVKKYRSSIFGRLIACLLFFFVPSIIFFLFGIIFDDTQYTVKDVRDCWNSVSIERNILKDGLE